MMKRWMFWLMTAIVVALVFIGFGYTKKRETQKQFDNLMSQAITNVQAAEYKKAELNLQDALRKKPDDVVAKQRLEQVKLYQEGLAELKQDDYEQAQLTFRSTAKISPSLSILTQRAKKKDKLLESVLKQREKYDDLYNKAVRLTEIGAYSQSNENLFQILDGKNIDEKYYSQVRKDARELQERNNSILEQIRIQNQQAAIRRQREQQRQEKARKVQQAAASSSSSAENQNGEPKKNDDKNDDRNSGQDNVKDSSESKPETNNSATEPQPNNENK
ncbi:hypothetical protein HF867_05070 [Lactobacillus salivarius]|nr:hypothetical protein [Ligilactobacillus salivarius]